MSKVIIQGNARPLKGEFTPPGDKSISHRAALLGGICDGETTVRGFLSSDDTLSSVKAMQMLGVEVEFTSELLRIRGRGLHGLKEPDDVIDAGNSGTTSRLISGILSAQGFFSAITGDKYLRARPMERVVKPLSLMGARFSGRNGGKNLPLAIQGGALRGVRYELPVASAQVKSAILLAGIYAGGETEVVEPTPTRDHTERMLAYFGAEVRREGRSVKVKTTSTLRGGEVVVPADISSAAFFIAAALINPNSQVLIRNVGVNPHRTGVINIFRQMGGRVEILNEREVSGEPIADLLASSSALRGIQIGGDLIARAIDELPVIAAAACFAEGETTIRDAKELRVKETDRIRATSAELQKLGADIQELPDGMIIKSGQQLRGARCDSWGDHRIAMSVAIAATRATGETEINGSECVSVSFPEFFEALRDLRGGL
ncbi:MAG: 3-phosphoshikimate 1-carboxyvinyltransferase [Deltaproteobacteria bacterium]